MQTLVTGGAGFIGSHLTDLLLANGHSVTVLDNLCGGWMKNLREAEKRPRFKFVPADIRDPKSLAGHFDGIDWVFHLAALADIVPSIEKPRDYFETNVDGTFNVAPDGWIPAEQLRALCAPGPRVHLPAVTSCCGAAASAAIAWRATIA